MQEATSPRYRVISAGRPLGDFSNAQVREELSRRFKLNTEQLDRLLSRPTIIKQELDHSQAEKYLQALRSAGLDARLVEVQASSQAQPLPEQPTPSTKPAPESGQPHANPETEMLTTDQLESQFAEPIPRLPVSWTYKLGLMGVMVVSLIAPVIYFSLVLAVLAGLLWYLILLPGLLAKTHGAMATLFTVTFIPFICSVFLLFLARPLFIRFPPPRSLALERRKNRRLFQLVELMCERM
ncbi:MAG: hypothetical protein R3276_16035, partial [Marinobacter sp.]|nr:hypothetical protein [Marinobacter sp.]